MCRGLPGGSAPCRIDSGGGAISRERPASPADVSADGLPSSLERLTPHDLVSYFRCPHEMELHRWLSLSRSDPATQPLASGGVRPLPRSPLLPPPLSEVEVCEGRLDIFEGDRLVYEDEREEGLPLLVPLERVALDPRFRGGGSTLHDPELGLSGRPDMVIARTDGTLEPVEYKSTHLFVGYHDAHGRLFDTIQAIAECRLVEAAFGVRPRRAIVLYGDQRGGGAREGWIEFPYADAEERWLRGALQQIRTDPVRAPVSNGRICAGCEANRRGLCRFAASRFDPGVLVRAGPLAARF